jgi:hypothetical protein
VVPYVEHLLRRYDQTLTTIVADPRIARDADHPHYDDLRVTNGRPPTATRLRPEPRTRRG